MKIYQLMIHQGDIGCGDSSNIVVTGTMYQELEDIKNHNNSEHGYKSETEYLEWSIEIIDTEKLKELTKDQIIKFKTF